ncbi:MAG: C4-dicarboxylate ABC transporter permease [Deltaproteobacteria bacterium]|nr:C4-dicarboxylate ABC transporter permease [Deltaproteobacteria bacterium]
MATEKEAPLRGPDGLLDQIGNAISWIWLLLIAVIVTAVILRFVFGVGFIQLEELQWHLYAIGFLAGIVGCVVHDRHVRVDVLRERMTPRTQRWVDFYGLLLFQLPLVGLVLWSALPLVADSFATGEKSASAGGLPYRWLLKAFLPLSFVGLGIATLTRIRRTFRALFPRNEA